MLRAMLAPTLGITGVLAALWTVAATLGGVMAPAARALDPAVPGSLAAMWGPLQLATAACFGLAATAPCALILGPALLLLGEVGELHLLLAEAVSGRGAASLPWAKGAAAATLVLVAIAPLCRDAHRPPGTGTIVACLVLGGIALALDAVQGEVRGPEPLLASLEEWSELAMESLLAAAYWAALGNGLVLRPKRRKSSRRGSMEADLPRSFH